MAWEDLDTRDSTDVNASADVNQLQLNLNALKGGTITTAPTTDIETLETDKLAISDLDDTPSDDSETAVTSKWIYDNVGLSPYSIVSSAKSADYTILDSDGIGTILMTVGSSTDKTVTLPTAADNKDREIVIIKADAGTNKLIVDGEGSETINGSTTTNLISQYDRVKVKCDGASWYVLDSNITYDSGWVSLTTWTNATISLGHNFGVTMEKFSCQILWSTSGVTGADNYNIFTTVMDTVGQVTATNIKNVDTNTLSFQTGAYGAAYLNSSGAMTTINSGYYKIILKRIL